MRHAIKPLILSLIVLALGGLPPVTAHAAAAGKVLYAFGPARAASTDGATRTLRRGVEVSPGDKLTTGRRGRLQVRFTDGGFISLRQNSEFQIDAYRYEGRADGREKGFFSLFRGAMRAVTGAIGRTNKQTYRVKTPVATIGIRGTAFLLNMCVAGACIGPDGLPLEDGLYGSVGDGEIFAENAGGTREFVAGQNFYTPNADTAPQQTTQQPPPLVADATKTPAEEPEFAAGDERGDEGLLPGQEVPPTGPTDCISAGTCLAGLVAVSSEVATDNPPLGIETHRLQEVTVFLGSPPHTVFGASVDPTLSDDGGATIDIALAEAGVASLPDGPLKDSVLLFLNQVDPVLADQNRANPAAVAEFIQLGPLALLRWAANPATNSGTILSVFDEGFGFGIQTEIDTLVDHQSWVAAYGPPPDGPIPTGIVATFDFAAGTRSTSLSGASDGPGVISGTLTLNTMSTPMVSANFRVDHNMQLWDVNAQGPLLQDFAFDTEFSGTTSVDMVGCCTIPGNHKVAGGFVGKVGPNGPEAAGLVYVIDYSGDPFHGAAGFLNATP